MIKYEENKLTKKRVTNYAAKRIIEAYELFYVKSLIN